VGTEKPNWPQLEIVRVFLICFEEKNFARFGPGQKRVFVVYFGGCRKIEHKLCFGWNKRKTNQTCQLNHEFLTIVD